METEQAAAARIADLQQRLSRQSLVFRPVALAAEMAAFEQAHGVMLPAEYRLFVERIGNGGAGPPAYGLKPLGTNESWWFEEQRAAWLHFTRIRHSFPFSEPWLWEDDEPLDEARQATVFDGNIYLGTDGCGINWALIVSGPQRGQVWQLTEMGILPCRPSLTFSEWFDKWLSHEKSSPELFWWTE